ncbi:hypothetical protein [uncultured Gammaproteobacteria bacterium]|jgi:hypothetical protein|nr:hypothetical protein [uncultured Gammaproteobacteria bacterium]CAC9638167.1 hypothetical protein [uncultured Gammaproteobacteria bacterium]CAC9642809.1 hypothetical protein [uncultured Gammaproteobacteria bacterium]SHN93216.1 hypothetical protein BCLUESOX_421 [bacterium endosymbiont of Bathymodiolus sp. 5 South]VVH62915.1 hypothetical protein BSPWISOX_1234 [uncultured Gammaproteobacteria bacterium]
MIYFTKSEGVNFFNAGGNFFNFFQCRGVALIMKNTVKFQLNHFFKNTLSSVFNQFETFA